jgi:formate-dependent phosphoribosylglycinamide formyltransferase (GAR transformylase)
MQLPTAKFHVFFTTQPVTKQREVTVVLSTNNSVVKGNEEEEKAYQKLRTGTN